jgi:hypothetical protein
MSKQQTNKPPSEQTTRTPERVLAAAAGVLQAAEQVIADLQARRSALLTRQAELEAGRGKAAFLAHTCGGDGERLLAELNAETATVADELRDVDAALVVGNERATDAKHRLEQIEDQVRRDQIATELSKLVVIAGRLDSALADIATASKEMLDITDALSRLGDPHPNRSQLDSLGFRALSTALANTVWSNHFQRLAPASRISFTALATAWAGRADSNDKEAAA